MTKEEYENCVSKINTGSSEEQLQAVALLAILPTFESRTKISDSFKLVNDAIDNKLKELNNDWT